MSGILGTQGGDAGQLIGAALLSPTPARPGRRSAESNQIPIWKAPTPSSPSAALSDDASTQRFDDALKTARENQAEDRLRNRTSEAATAPRDETKSDSTRSRQNNKHDASSDAADDSPDTQSEGHSTSDTGASSADAQAGDTKAGDKNAADTEKKNANADQGQAQADDGKACADAQAASATAAQAVVVQQVQVQKPTEPSAPTAAKGQGDNAPETVKAASAGVRENATEVATEKPAAAAGATAAKGENPKGKGFHKATVPAAANLPQASEKAAVAEDDNRNELKAAANDAQNTARQVRAGDAHSKSDQSAASQNDSPDKGTPTAQPATAAAAMPAEIVEATASKDISTSPHESGVKGPANDAGASVLNVQAAGPVAKESAAHGAESAGSAQESPRPDPSDPMDQIVLGLKGKMDARTGKAEISMNPPNLGAVKVSVSLEHGTLTAEFQSSSDVVRDLLRSNMEKLKGVLQSQGVAVDRLAVAPSPVAAESSAARGQGQQGSFGSAAHDGRSAGQNQQDSRPGQRRPDSDAFARVLRQANDAPIDLVA